MRPGLIHQCKKMFALPIQLLKIFFVNGVSWLRRNLFRQIETRQVCISRAVRGFSSRSSSVSKPKTGAALFSLPLQSTLCGFRLVKRQKGRFSIGWVGRAAALSRRRMLHKYCWSRPRLKQHARTAENVGLRQRTHACPTTILFLVVALPRYAIPQETCWQMSN